MPENELGKLPAPMQRALIVAGYTSLESLNGASQRALAVLHGVGPKGLRILEQLLAASQWKLNP